MSALAGGRVATRPVESARGVESGRPIPARWEPWPRPLTAVAGVAALFLALPVIVLAARALLGDGLRSIVGAPEVLEALGLSLATSAASLVLTVLLGLPLAITLARGHSRAIAVLEAIVDLPIVLPPAVAGLGLLLVFGRHGLLGPALNAFGLSVPFTTLAVILAQTFVAAPFFIRSARSGIAAVGADLEDAARVDGAHELAVLRSVTLPLASGALGAGLVMSWARSLGEFGATIMFAGNVAGRTQTLPLLVYADFQGGNLDVSIAAGAILIVAAFGVLVAIRGLRWQRALDMRGLG